MVPFKHITVLSMMLLCLGLLLKPFQLVNLSRAALKIKPARATTINDIHYAHSD